MVANKYVILVLTIFGFLFAAIGNVHPQGSGSKPIIVNGNNNESAKANLDWVAQSAGDNQTIIVIARTGTNELTRNLNSKRLQTIRLYLQNMRGISKEKIVTAEGKRVTGKGRVEIYLGGHLFMVFNLVRNKNFAPAG
jgi:hypothetical protein